MKYQGDKIIYSLTIEDIQRVSIEEFGRELNASEIQFVVEEIEKRTPWYDIIADSINEFLGVRESDQE